MQRLGETGLWRKKVSTTLVRRRPESAKRISGAALGENHVVREGAFWVIMTLRTGFAGSWILPALASWRRTAVLREGLKHF